MDDHKTTKIYENSNFPPLNIRYLSSIDELFYFSAEKIYKYESKIKEICSTSLLETLWCINIRTAPFTPILVYLMWKLKNTFVSLGSFVPSEMLERLQPLVHTGFHINFIVDAFDAESVLEVAHKIDRNVQIIDRKDFNLDKIKLNILSLQWSVGRLNINGLSTLKNICYCAYTSGSTGLPKIVFVPYQSILPNIIDLKQFLNCDDKMFLSSPFSFDPAILQLLTACHVGCELVVFSHTILSQPDLFTICLLASNVTFLQCTPSLLYMIGKNNVRMLMRQSSLRFLILGGEPFPSIQNWCDWTDNFKIGSKIRLFNIYGTTEISVWACLKEVSMKTLKEHLHDDKFAVSLGNPLSETNFNISPLESSDFSVDIHQDSSHKVGQLYISSSTRFCFLSDDSENEIRKKISESQQISRCTGDLVLQTDENVFYYQGRVSNSIKMYGRRVNLDLLASSFRIKYNEMFNKNLNGTSNLLNVLYYPINVNSSGSLQIVSVRGDSKTADSNFPNVGLSLVLIESDKDSLSTIYNSSTNTKIVNSPLIIEDFVLDISLNIGTRFIIPHNLAILPKEHVIINNHGKIDHSKTLDHCKYELKPIFNFPSADLNDLEKIVTTCWQKVLLLDDSNIDFVDSDRTFSSLGGDSFLAAFLSSQLHYFLHQTCKIDDSIPFNTLFMLILNSSLDHVIKTLKARLVNSVLQRHLSFPSNLIFTPEVSRDFAFRTDSSVIYPNQLFFLHRSEKNLSSHNSNPWKCWECSADKCVDTSPMVCVFPSKHSDTDSLSLAYIGSHGGSVYCISIDDGKVVWSRYLEGRIEHSPTISADRKLLIVSSLNSIYMLEALSGDIDWIYTNESLINSSILVYHNSLFFGTYDRHLVCVDYSSKVKMFEIGIGCKPLKSKPCIFPYLSSNLLVDSPQNCIKILVVASLSGNISAFSLSDPHFFELRWETSTKKNFPVFSDVIAIGTDVCVTSVAGQILVLASATGLKKWSIETEIPFFTSPSFLKYSDSCLLLCVASRKDRVVYFIDSEDGTTHFAHSLDFISGPFDIHSHPLVILSQHTSAAPSHLMMIFTISSGAYLVSLTENRLISRIPYDFEVFSTPVIVKNQVIFGTRTDKILSYLVNVN